MSKELEALKTLSHIANYTYSDYEYEEEEIIIEQALKELEERREMMKKFNDACVPMILDNETEKKLNALEIIKHFIKSIGLTFIFSNDKTIVIVGGDEFEYWYKCETQAEYDLLKEVLKDE